MKTKKRWTDNIKSKADLEERADLLLRRIKRDSSAISIETSYLMAGHRNYILNDSFVNRKEAKEWLIEKMWAYFNLPRELEFTKREKTEVWAKTQLIGESSTEFHKRIKKDGRTTQKLKTCYLAPADYVMDKMIISIYQDSGKWRLQEIKNEKECWYKPLWMNELEKREFPTPEEAMEFSQSYYSEKIESYLEAFN